MGEGTARPSQGPSSSGAFCGPLSWPAALVASLTGRGGCWPEALPERTAWAGPGCGQPGRPGAWASGSRLWSPSPVPGEAWAWRGSAGSSKCRGVLVSRPGRGSRACSLGTSVSRLDPLAGTEFTWALLNSDNTLEVFKQTCVMGLSAGMPKAKWKTAVLRLNKITPLVMAVLPAPTHRPSHQSFSPAGTWTGSVTRWVVRPRVSGDKAHKAEKRTRGEQELPVFYPLSGLTVGLASLLSQIAAWPVPAPCRPWQSLGEWCLRAGLQDCSLGCGLGWSEDPLSLE